MPGRRGGVKDSPHDERDTRRPGRGDGDRPPDRGESPLVTALDLARMQFGITTIFHFFFVPVSIGLAFYIAICQTRHYRTGKEIYARQVNFFGKLVLIS